MNPVVMAQINGLRVCGQRGGYSFANVTRGISNTTGGLCPTGY